MHELYQQKTPLVLVAEDNKVTQRTITIFLQKEGYEVVEAENGQQAVSIVDKQNPDLVLMDISMPVMDGCTACGQISEKLKENAPPVIMITSFEESEAVEKAFKAGAVDYITKPINWTVLKNRMQLILKERQATQSLKQLSHQYQLILDAAGEGILELNADGDIRFANPAAERMLGCSKESLIGLPFHATFHRSRHDGRVCRQEDCHIYDAAVQGMEYYSDEEVFCHKDGTPFTVKLSSTPIIEGETLLGVVFVFNDITRQIEEQTLLRHKATHDTLTGLPNRHLLNDHLLESIALAHRDSQFFAILFIDVDNFKPLNDQFGRHFGDQVIKEIGRRISTQIRFSDKTYRYGDDEFIVLLQGIKDIDDAAPVAEDILEVLGEVIQIDGKELSLSASIGISMYPSDSQDPQTLIRQADQAMFHAKQNGKSGFALYHSFAER